MTDRELMQMALDVLENHTAIKHPQQIAYRDGAIKALRDRLAQDDLDEAIAKGTKAWEGVDPTKFVEELRGDPEVPCKTHPDAPHGFDRNASHSADRYVCECESWEPSKREWVGLHEHELEVLKYNDPSGERLKLAKAVEAKLKEKNT